MRAPMMFRSQLAVGLILALTPLLGCDLGEKPSDQCDVTPSSWAAPEWETNAKDALALRERLLALTGATLMRGAETGTVNLSVPDLTAAYEAGTPSLKSATSTFFNGVVTDAFEEFVEATGAGAQSLVDSGGNWTPGAEGGIWTTNTRAFNEGGLEIRQVLDKALFGGAALYNYAVGLTTGSISEATIDAIAAAFGTNPNLNPGRSSDAVVENRNFHSANYLYQMGLYAEARQALIDAKAYAADERCTEHRDSALKTFFQTWEKGLFVRYLFYANKAATGMATATTDDLRGTALHDLAEGLGLAFGFSGVPAPTSGPLAGTGRKMTDARIATVLEAVGVNVTADLGDATTGEFVSNAAGLATGTTALENVIVEAFGLTQEELTKYRNATDG
jgi:hypothetical protein